ncbi:STAS/SEC14 domain-containing protein [Pinibacter soli]|uniref:STAS/SEC14 domain-containing protein n=1 Tax=Pinibacter soli TaxID=3044211 RepID=A0ABT6RDP0_9BACT|nr:STAS/SEC14 domain-containing protein [Pinibacter soli]MDI3320682.1 STAS/SEC14 domain-containing protein [Pinibacter soli]
MLKEIKPFKGNSLAFELTDTFTEEDSGLIKQLFEEKLNNGAAHVNLLIKFENLSVMWHMNLKAFLEGEIWGFRHFNKIGRCAVVAHSDVIKSVVKVENKILHLVNTAFEEKYFDTAQLNEALQFIAPGE